MCGHVFLRDVEAERRKPRFLTSAEPGIGLTLLLGARTGAILHLFGGYRPVGERKTMLLFRWHHVASPYDGILKIETRNRVRIAELEEDEMLRPAEWESFLAIPEGQEFSRDGRRWRKTTKVEIEALVRDRVYTIASLLRGRRR